MRLALRIAVLGACVFSAPASAQKSSDKYDDIFRKYSKRYFGVGFDWKYFKAQAMAESELNPTAESRVGARGLMQLMPSTFKEIQTKRPELASIDDPEWNIAAGIMHDRHLWRQWTKNAVPDSQLRLFMTASYNAGEGTITRATAVAKGKQLDHAHWSNIEIIAPTVPRWRYRETLPYVRKIEKTYEALTRK